MFTGLVDGHEEEGLVVRKSHVKDRRIKVIETTSERKWAFTRSQEQYEKRIAELLLTLPSDMRRAMLEGHPALIERLTSGS